MMWAYFFWQLSYHVTNELYLHTMLDYPSTSSHIKLSATTLTTSNSPLGRSTSGGWELSLLNFYMDLRGGKSKITKPKWDIDINLDTPDLGILMTRMSLMLRTNKEAIFRLYNFYSIMSTTMILQINAHEDPPRRPTLTYHISAASGITTILPSYK